MIAEVLIFTGLSWLGTLFYIEVTGKKTEWAAVWAYRKQTAVVGAILALSGLGLLLYQQRRF